MASNRSQINYGVHFRSYQRRTLSSPPFLSSSPIVSPRLHTKRCHVFPLKKVQSIVMKLDPAGLYIRVSFIFTVFLTALKVYTTGITVGNAIHDLKQFPKRFSKFRLEGHGIFKSLLKVFFMFFDRAEKPEDLNATLITQVRVLNDRLQSLDQFHACCRKKSDSTAVSTTDLTIGSTVDSPVCEIDD